MVLTTSRRLVVQRRAAINGGLEPCHISIIEIPAHELHGHNFISKMHATTQKVKDKEQREDEEVLELEAFFIGEMQTASTQNQNVRLGISIRSHERWEGSISPHIIDAPDRMRGPVCPNVPIGRKLMSREQRVFDGLRGS
jgi:hypothetical protein